MRQHLALALVVSLPAAIELAVGQSFPLAQYFSASPADVTALQAGRVITRVDAPDKREVVGAAVIRVATTADRLIRGFRRVSGLKQSDLVLATGHIDPVPAAADFAGLTLEPSDVRSLAECRVARCGMKLSAASIERFRREVPWGTPRAHARAEALFREMLAEEARGYLRGGDAALDELVDRHPPLNRAVEYAAILEHGANIDELTPGLGRQLAAPPGAPLKTPDEFLYWSKMAIGLKPVISITHVRVHRAPPPSADVVVTSKQVYASHYFDSSLSVTALVSSGPGSPGYLLYINRSRIDLFTGLFGGITRSIVRKRVREGLEKNMRLAKVHLERPE